MASGNRIPKPESLQSFSSSLFEMVAQTSWLPDPVTVKALPRAIFPTVRATNQNPRFSYIIDNEKQIGMYDDNTTPRWALLWAHGLQDTNRNGWTFAHVWPVSQDMRSYTHLANLAMVPEALGSLTDKQGPLTSYLRWHAYEVYGWKPEGKEMPEKPLGYDGAQWRYFQACAEPKSHINHELHRLDNKRVRIIRSLIPDWHNYMEPSK